MNITSWASGIGTVRSDRPLILRDDFPVAGRVEFDLSNRGFLDFLPLELAYAVHVEVGIRKLEGERPRCLNFLDMRAGRLPNPYVRLGVFIETFDRNKDTNSFNEIVSTDQGNALLLTALNSVKCDEDVKAIEFRFVAPRKLEISASDASGQNLRAELVSDPSESVHVYRLEGDRLHDTVIALEGEAYLLSLCLEGDMRHFVEVQATGFHRGSEVARTVLIGAPGEVVTASLFADAIDQVRFSSGAACLIDLCWASVFHDARGGWKPLERVNQPITLPVLHPDYPASGNQATDLPSSRNDALARIKYGDPAQWATPFDDIHEQCLNLVTGGPAVPMADPSRAVTFPAEPELGDTSTPPAIPQQHPLQLLLLAGMHAPIAQILGLYWSDETAQPGQMYDYLIVADHQGQAGHQVQKILSQIISEGFVNLDGYIVFGKQVEQPEPLEPPSDARVFSLPGTTRPDLAGGVLDASCNAGLKWHLPVVNNVLLPESPVLYHLWRAGYGASEPSAQAATDEFDPLTKEDPLLVVENLLSMIGVERPPDWPPFPLYGFDNAVAEGWYGYRVSNIDIFGRHSALGLDARWFEWAPTPIPRPWYYVDPHGDKVVHPFAVGLLDKIAPPPPTGTEAFALDPDDPFVQRDHVYDDWFATLSASEQAAVIGLRVRWNWTEAHMRQAPDTQEFRVYYQNGRLNTLLGRTMSVTAASATESLVETDITNNSAAGAYVGCSLKLGSDMFTIVGSDATTPLRLRVNNIGPLNDVVPAARANCEVNVPNNHSLFINYGVAHAWEERYYVVGFNEHVTMDVDSAGRPLRRYEVVIPAQVGAFRGGLPLNPDLADPVKFAAIGVTAADGRAHTADDPKWAAGRFGGRVGNESSMGPPAVVFRVLRERPAAPVPPPDSERVFATPADYHAASYYTFRWVPQAHLKTHVYRAMDDSVFNVDWSFQPRAPIDAGDLSFFPDENVEARWNAVKRQQVADELNELNTFPHTAEGKVLARVRYKALSNDALRVLANLPGNEAAFAQVTVFPLDADDPANANRVGPDNPVNFVVDPGLRIYVDTLDGRSTNRYFYRACYVDGAQNRSRLGLSGPPIWLPNVVPPKPPTFTKVLAGDADSANPGDNKVTLRWASNREEDLAEYRVYRASSETDSRSIRSMSLVHTLVVAAGLPEDRPSENVWTDTGLAALQWTYYRMTAVDSAGNESPANDVVRARAFDESLPTVPALAVAWEQLPANKARAQWNAATETRLERRAATELIWEEASGWLPAGNHVFDDSIDEHFPWKFRLRARKATGAVSVGPEVNLPRK